MKTGEIQLADMGSNLLKDSIERKFGIQNLKIEESEGVAVKKNAEYSKQYSGIDKEEVRYTQRFFFLNLTFEYRGKRYCIKINPEDAIESGGKNEVNIGFFAGVISRIKSKEYKLNEHKLLGTVLFHLEKSISQLKGEDFDEDKERFILREKFKIY